MLTPRNTNVIVELDSPKTEVNGIYIPESFRQSADTGIVVAVSPKVEDLSVGDRVYFDMYSGATLNVGGKTYLVFDQRGLYAKV